METNKEKIRYILQYFFDKGENASQAAEIVNGVYGADTVTANYVQFWFRRFRSGNFDVKDAPRKGRPVVKNVDKIIEKIQVDRHVSSRSIAQELNIDHKTVLNHLRKDGYKKKLDVWVPIRTEDSTKEVMNNEKVKFLLNWNHFGEHLSSCMTKLMTDSSYSDIIIATADKRMIYSHQFVLANSSKYFQRLFRHVNRQRGVQLVVALPEIKYEIFKILMNYMYKGETQVPHELLPSVIKAGQFLEINGLVNLNENESSGTGENSKVHPKMAQSPASVTDAKSINRNPSSLRNNVHARESMHVSSKSVIQEKTKRRSVNEENPSKSPAAEETGKENRSKQTKSVKCKNLPREKKEMIQLPVKRKSFMRENVKKTSPVPSPSSSVSSESGPPKKVQKRPSLTPEVYNVKVKEEKENSKSPIHENETENENEESQQLEEKITIKMEVPDDMIEEVVYNELQCEFCHDVYTNPSDWVRHMTDQHGDRGYQTYKDLDKSVGGSAVITCVVCSSVCFSAAEWAKHLRMWHTERELTVANLSESKKTTEKAKRKSGLHKKE